jgi:solute carrier family 25 citrate transporter 1
MLVACAGAVSVFVNNPIDVIKTKMQGLDAAQYKSVVDCARKVLQQHGPSYFYRGVTPRLARVCGDAAITFTAYNELVPFYKNLLA